MQKEKTIPTLLGHMVAIMSKRSRAIPPPSPFLQTALNPRFQHTHLPRLPGARISQAPLRKPGLTHSVLHIPALTQPSSTYGIATQCLNSPEDGSPSTWRTPGSSQRGQWAAPVGQLGQLECLQEKLTHLSLGVAIAGARLPGVESSASSANKPWGLRQVTSPLPRFCCSHLWNKHLSPTTNVRVKWDNICSTLNTVTGVEELMNLC